MYKRTGMPNGISCAFFAGKNLIYGQKESNIFKEGIAGAQTARTVDYAARSGIISAPVSITGKIAKVAKKFLYPLIVLSGVYNTVKADDKVKTGAEQAGGIASMFTCETIATKGLESLNKKILNMDCVKNNKAARAAVYILKGAGFIAASVTGYNVGSKTAGKIVDNIRNKKNNQDDIQEKEDSEINVSTETVYDTDENVFNEILL